MQKTPKHEGKAEWRLIRSVSLRDEPRGTPIEGRREVYPQHCTMQQRRPIPVPHPDKKYWTRLDASEALVGVGKSKGVLPANILVLRKRLRLPWRQIIN